MVVEEKSNTETDVNGVGRSWCRATCPGAVHHGRKNEKPGLRQKDFACPLDAVHQQLRSPILLVWDNSTQHVDKLRHLVPPQCSLGNLAAPTTGKLATLARNRRNRLHPRTTLTNPSHSTSVARCACDTSRGQLGRFPRTRLLTPK